MYPHFQSRRKGGEVAADQKARSVSCDYCGETVKERGKNCKQIRRDLTQKAWQTAVSYWHLPSAAGLNGHNYRNQLEFYERHPELKGQTADACPRCMAAQWQKARAHVAQHFPADSGLRKFYEGVVATIGAA
jgi:DNA-directed RNA polymerase subunit RPC12/RpoP